MAQNIRAQISLGLILGAVHASVSLAGPASATYTYDELGRLLSGTFSSGRKVDYQYDAAGNRTTMTMGNAPSFTIGNASRSEEHTSELQSLMRISYAVFCLKKKQYDGSTEDSKNKVLSYSHQSATHSTYSEHKNNKKRQRNTQQKTT